MTRCGCGNGEAGKFTSMHHMAPGCDLVSDEARAEILAGAAESRLAGNCPMGCGRTLFRDVGGRISCSMYGCSRRTAVDELLADGETEHLVRLDEDGFSVQHPLRERLDGLLFDCDLPARIAALDGPPRRPGLYRVTVRPGTAWLWAVVPS